MAEPTRKKNQGLLESLTVAHPFAKLLVSLLLDLMLCYKGRF